MRQSFPAQSLRSIDVTPWLAIGNAIFTGRLSEDSLSRRCKQNLDNMNNFPRAHSLSTPQSAQESHRTSSALNKPPKETNWVLRISSLSFWATNYRRKLHHEKSRGTTETRKFFWSVVQWIKSLHMFPNNIWRSGLCRLRARQLQKNQSLHLSVQMKCWNVYRQCLKQFSWTMWKLALSTKIHILISTKTSSKENQRVLVDLPLFSSLHSLC